MNARLALLPLLLSSLSALAADGLVVPSGQDLWPQWQARITLGNATLSPVTLTSSAETGRHTLQSGALFSDYYLDAPGLRLPSSLGGLRATGGLMVGPRGLALGGTATPLRGGRLGLAVQNGTAATSTDGASGDTVPYLGIGYTGLALKGGWGVSADLGLVAERPGAGRGLLGTAGWDSTLREMRISPVLQLGLSYAF